jgi:hypothetical protein
MTTRDICIAVGAALGAIGAGLAAWAATRPKFVKLDGLGGLGGPCLRVGHGNPEIKVQERVICPTEAQEEFIDAQRRIACGVFACAYERSDGKVAKVTQDPTDIYNLQVGQEHPHVVKLYDAREIPNQHDPEHKFYVAITEKLEQPPWEMQAALRRMRPALKILDRAWEKHSHGSKYRVEEDDRERFIDGTCGNGGPLECRRLAEGVVELHEFYGRKGIRMLDLHPGNFGVDATGKWKVLDVGFSKTRTPKVPVLMTGVTRKTRGRLLHS